MKEELLRVEGLRIKENALKIVSNINLFVRKGECITLMGLNNSGKDVISRLFQGNSKVEKGSIFIENKKILHFSREEFERHKVFYIGHERVFIETLDISENVFLLRNNSLRKIFINEKAIHMQADYLMKKYGLQFSAYTKADKLTLAQKHLVSIVKAVDQGAKLIVLHELTSGYSMHEIQQLLELILLLKKEQISLIICDNRSEPFQIISDGIIVMRNGEIVKKIHEGDSIALGYEAMLQGKSPKKDDASRVNPQEDIRLVYEGFQIKENMPFSFHVKKGEILLLSTIDSNEQKSIWDVFTARGKWKPKITLDGNVIVYTCMEDLVKKRMAFTGNSEPGMELFDNMTTVENVLLPSLKRISNFWGLYGNKYERLLETDISFFQKKLTNKAMIATQWNEKVEILLGRWKLFHPKVLILCNFISTADILGKEMIRRELFRMAKRGTSIILLEADIYACASVAHRILTVHNGIITGELSDKDFEEADVKKYFTL